MARFRAFCVREHVPEAERFPVSEPVICAFAASRSGLVSGSTARNDVAGVRAFHVARNAAWPASERLRLILEGVERLRPPSSHQPERPPVTLDLLRALADYLDPSSSRDAAILACAFVAFWGQCRLGELLPLSAQAYLLHHQPSRSSWCQDQLDALHLPWTKTTRSKGATVPLFRQSSRTCPVTCLRRFLRDHPAPRRAHLFAYADQGGTARPLVKRVFLARVNQVAATLGLPRITGHCFRIGGTTELLRQGVAPDVVKLAGRWASDSFLRYWRRKEEVLPRHMANVVVSGMQGR
jgi:integrase